MNCEGVRTVLGKGYSATTVAERNAACVHCRECEDCKRVLKEYVAMIPPAERAGKVLEAAINYAKDRADPEWK